LNFRILAISNFQRNSEIATPIGLASWPVRSSLWHCDPAEQSNHLGLTMAAGLFWHAAQLAADSVKRNTSNGVNFLDRFSGAKAAGDARFRRGQIEQRLPAGPAATSGESAPERPRI
jgi:hypothetical protein